MKGKKLSYWLNDKRRNKYKPTVEELVIQSKPSQTSTSPASLDDSYFSDPSFAWCSDESSLESLSNNDSKETTPPQLKKKILSPTVRERIEKFGGYGTRKSNLTIQKEKLNNLFSESKAATYEKKTKWFMCSETGVYKKKVVVDVQHNFC